MTRRSERQARGRGLGAIPRLLAVLTLFLSACSPGAPVPPASTAAPIPSDTAAVPSSPTATNPPPTDTPVPTAANAYRTGFPDPFAYAWTTVVTGLDLPVDVQNAGDGSGRLFVVEKPGRIRIIRDGQLLPAPFLDIRAEVGSRNNEQGLLGLAFHPDYAANGVFFVNYTDTDGNTVIARFHVSADNPDLADPASEADLLHVEQPYVNHNGGGLAFGSDGFLYIGLGDGGSGGDPLRNAQNPQTDLGKMLRIDVNYGDLYAIPPGNPFTYGSGLPEIWAIGLRNPWRFSFDRLTGDLYIADVGQNNWEEIDFVPAGSPGGLNFGWSYYEGTHPYHDQPSADVVFTAPVEEYSHDYGCSVTGGYVYRGTALPDWQGVYFYGDYCSGTVWGLIRTGPDTWQSQVLFSKVAQINTFGVDEAGELYLTDYQAGRLLRLVQR